MDPTRQRILDTMRTRHKVAARELARLLHVTAADVRHHLRALEAEGLAEKTGETLVDGRGRPAALYALTHPTNNLAGLVGHLLEPLEGDDAALAELAVKFSPGGPAAPGQHITQRLVAAMGRLDRLAYRARWEPHPEAPQVIFGNCPFVEVVADHPALCRMDALLLERLLGTEVEQVEKLVRNNAGTVECRFFLRSQDPKGLKAIRKQMPHHPKIFANR